MVGTDVDEAFGSGLVVYWEGFSSTGSDAGFDAEQETKERQELKKGMKRYGRSDY